MDQLDQEMLKNLDLLLDFDIAAEADNWDVIENLDDAEAAEKEKGSGSDSSADSPEKEGQ